MIFERLQAIIETREDEDILGLVNLLRSGLVRNLGNITAPRLFNRAYAGTKLLIEDYITHVALAIEHVAAYPTSSQPHGLTSQAKLDLLHDTRQAFGRTALVLQGGAIFGLCHIGVVKALHLRGILPRIICGTATGALIAALVGVHDEDELLDFLTPEGIDLSAFAIKAKRNKSRTSLDHDSASGMFATALRRIKRFVRDGYFLDVKVLEECVHANVGDSTFEEAYARTKRVLNITVPSPEGSGVPSLLNYLTAPNVVCDVSKLSYTVRLIQSAHLVSCNSIKLSQRTLVPSINASLQGLQRPNRAMVYFDIDHVISIAGLFKTSNRHSRFSPQPHRRVVQREPFHHFSGKAIHCPLSANLRCPLPCNRPPCE